MAATDQLQIFRGGGGTKTEMLFRFVCGVFCVIFFKVILVSCINVRSSKVR